MAGRRSYATKGKLERTKNVPMALTWQTEPQPDRCAQLIRALAIGGSASVGLGDYRVTLRTLRCLGCRADTLDFAVSTPVTCLEP